MFHLVSQVGPAAHRFIGSHLVTVAELAALAVIMGAAMVLARRRRAAERSVARPAGRPGAAGRAGKPGDGGPVPIRWYEKLLTLAAAAMATGLDAQGMWRVAGDALGMDPWLRVPLFGVFQIALIAEAIRARRNFLTSKGPRPSTGKDGRAVWTIAVGSGVVSALDAAALVAVVVRLGAPILAAWLWDRQLVGERAQLTGKTERKINHRFTLERVLVWLRVAEPDERTVSEVDRARRMDRIARYAVRMHQLAAIAARASDAVKKAAEKRAARAERRYDRLTERSAYAALLADANVRRRIREQVASLYGAKPELSPTAVADLAPWRPSMTAAERALCEQTRTQFRTARERVHGATYVAVPPVSPMVSAGSAPVLSMPGRVQVPVRPYPLPPVVPGAEPGSLAAEPAAEPGSVPVEPAVPTAEPMAEPVAGDAEPGHVDSDAVPEPGGLERNQDPSQVPEPGPEPAAPRTAKAAMRAHWDAEIGEGRMPDGPLLQAAAERAGFSVSGSFARRCARRWRRADRQAERASDRQAEQVEPVAEPVTEEAAA